MMPAWEQFLSFLDHELGAKAIDQWVRSMKMLRFDARNLYFEAHDPLQIAWFEEHIRPLANVHFLDNSQRPIRIHFNPEEARLQPSLPPTPPAFVLQQDRLDAEMTLAAFIKTAQNTVAYELISDIENSSFNPIYLFGPKHAGKTHLLMAAAHLLQSKGKKVFFVRAETFASHVVQAIRQGSMQPLRDAYRRIDALIVDDIDRLAKKNATQEEFFHTFNTLHLEHKPILLSSKLPPSQLVDIEPRLMSRFDWGISVALEAAPALPILQKKAELWRLPFSQEVLKWLVSTFPKDPLLALQALSIRAKGIPALSPAAAGPLLADLLAREAAQQLTADTILQATASHYGVLKEDILGKSHTRECVVPRQMAIYLCRKKLEMPFQAIGAIFKRDHSTIMASVRIVQKLLEEKQNEAGAAYHQIEHRLEHAP